jgi:hypothetical protein
LWHAQHRSWRYIRPVARECFCGCGRRLRWPTTRVSGFGERHDRALAALREWSLPELELRRESSGSHDYDSSIEELAAFIADGEVLRARLVGICHGEDEVGSGDRRQMNLWQHLALKSARSAQRDYARFRRERAALGEDVELREAIGVWCRSRGITHDELARLQAENYNRGQEQGLSGQEAADRINAAIVAGDDLPF